MSDCCEIIVHAEPTASSVEVTEPIGTLVVEDGPILEVSNQVTVLNMRDDAYLSLEISPPLYQVYPENQVAYAKRVDFDDDNNVIYKGEAVPGTIESEAKWRIQEITFVGPDEDVVIRWAGGTSNFDKVWNNHLTYNYI